MPNGLGSRRGKILATAVAAATFTATSTTATAAAAAAAAATTMFYSHIVILSY
jgi:hypothetical protein